MPVFKDRLSAWHQRLLRGQQGSVCILRVFITKQAFWFGMTRFLGNTRLFNNHLTEGSFVLEFRTQKACWKTRCALGRAYECGFWHSEQTLKQGNIETVIGNKIMAMVCTLSKGFSSLQIFLLYKSCFLFLFPLLKLCVLFICTVCIHIFYIRNCHIYCNHYIF